MSESIGSYFIKIGERINYCANTEWKRLCFLGSLRVVKFATYAFVCIGALSPPTCHRIFVDATVVELLPLAADLHNQPNSSQLVATTKKAALPLLSLVFTHLLSTHAISNAIFNIGFSAITVAEGLWVTWDED